MTGGGGTGPGMRRAVKTDTRISLFMLFRQAGFLSVQACFRSGLGTSGAGELRWNGTETQRKETRRKAKKGGQGKKMVLVVNGELFRRAEVV